MNSFGKLEHARTTFTLHNINLSAIDRQYMTELHELGMDHITKSLKDTESTLTKLSTRLEFVGLSKNKTRPYETILINEGEVSVYISPAQVSCSMCWHCRHPLPKDWQPLGLPLKYKKTDDTFECEGVFCSFNCIAAYIASTPSFRHNLSSVLMLMMYRKLFKCNYNLKIVPAPSWKLLKAYGGHLSIEEFQKSFQHVEYKSLQQTVRTDSIRIQQVAEMFIETFVKS